MQFLNKLFKSKKPENEEVNPPPSKPQNNELNAQLITYFQAIYVSKTFKYNDIANVFRDEIVKEPPKLESNLLTGAIFDDLKCKIHLVWWQSTPIVAQTIVAVYENTNEILWLDNDENNSDFIEFINRENLGELLPKRQDEFVEFMIIIRGKRFVGNIKLLDKIHDIPKWQSNIQETEKQELQHQLENIAPKIQPPSIKNLGSEIIQLEFFIWTQWYGNLIQFVLEFEKSKLTSFSEKTMCKLVGDLTIPK